MLGPRQKRGQTVTDVRLHISVTSTFDDANVELSSSVVFGRGEAHGTQLHTAQEAFW